ncbi:MAG: sodium-dependent transporter [Flavobacteriaceae bacterium]|jgi:NSS family neurotransmitter:Na+ symporter|nr:sodium-dependent transporter [Flavobacteriaceae bacterium]
MKRDSFSSQIGALLAMVGSAVGLGGLWKFPYVAGVNGGGAFILIYIVFLLILCFPLMLSELIIGRRSKKNPVGAFRKLKPDTHWYATGFIAVVTTMFIISFYSVVGGWTIEYLVVSVFSGIRSIDENHFNDFVSSPYRPILMHLAFFGMTAGIIWTGIKDGIEKYSKILMPLLFLMILVLAVYSVNLSGAREGVEFMFKPDFSKLTGKVVLEALGMGLFTLSLGMGIILTYSSYIGEKENLVKLSLITIVMSLVFSCLAGLTILPAVFSFGLNPGQGPGLIFVTLPKVFSQMPFGSLLAPVFFAVALIASLTSSISLLEVVIAYLSEELKISRRKSIIISTVLFTVTGSLCSLSLGYLSDFKILGRNIFDLFDQISSIILMPVCAFLISVFVGWKMKKEDIYDELTNKHTVKVSFFNLYVFLTKYFVPLAILLIFLNSLFEAIIK